MSRNKISMESMKSIAKMNLKGSQFEYLSNVLKVCESTARKADKIGSLLNRIDKLEAANRLKDAQISILKSSKSIKLRKGNRN